MRLVGTHSLVKSKSRNMGRGVSAGGGQSSLGYLFGSGEAPKPTERKGGTPTKVPDTSGGTSHKSTASVPQVDITKQIPAGIQGSQANNYFRTDGQNRGNFITFNRGWIISISEDQRAIATCETGLRPRSTQPLVVDLPWATCLEVVAMPIDAPDPQRVINYLAEISLEAG